MSRGFGSSDDLGRGGPFCASIKHRFTSLPKRRTLRGMDKSAPRSFMSRVRASIAHLHPSERRLAETVLNFPGDMAGYTASEIADLAGVSNATVSRFVRKIGYASYEEARRAVRDGGQTGAALLRFGAADHDCAQAAAAHLEQSQANLAATYAELDATALDALVSALHVAPRVWLAGFRAGYPLANYLAWQIGQVLPQVNMIPRAGETLAESAATFGPEDVVILLFLRRASSAARAVVETASTAKSQVAVIGDAADLEALPARWRFACATSSNGPLLNHTGVIAVCNLIATRTLETSGVSGRRRMEQIEEMHDQLGEL